MGRKDRQALSLSGIGLGATAIALAAQQLWPHAPWYVWFVILCVGIALILLSAIILIQLHLSRRAKFYLAFCVVIFLGGGSVWYYYTLPDRRPLSVIELYLTDFPNYFGSRGEYTVIINNQQLPVLINKHRDFISNSYFASFYIYDTPLLYDVSSQLANRHAEILTLVNSQGFITGRMPGDTSSMPDSDLQFTHLFYIYHYRELTPEQIGELHKLFRDQGLIVQFRGPEYLSHHLWDYDRRDNNWLRQFRESNPNGLRN